MRNFKELKVWERSHEFCLKIYDITLQFPKEEKFGLISQIRRAFYSVPMNISEGCGYETNKEFGRFLKFSSGSISEVEYCLLLARDLKYISVEKFTELTTEAIVIRKMLFKLKATLK